MPPTFDDRKTNDALEAIVALAHRAGHGFTVLAIGLGGGAAEARAAAGAARGLLRAEHGVEEAAAEVATLDGAGSIVIACAVLSPGRDVVALGSAVAASLRLHADASVGVATSVGHAELTLDGAIAVALEGLEVARSSGSSSAVHTELYELILRSPWTHDVAREPAREDPDDVVPTSEAEDPFSRMAADAPLETHAPAASHESAVPARDRATLAAEIEKLQGEQERLVGEDRHARALLERRLAKIVAELEAAEVEIDRLRKGSAREPGRASIYREVQGLDESTPLAPVKRRLIDGVFRENVADEGGSTASRQ